MTRLGRDPFTLLIVVLAGLGTAHILVRTATYGAAVVDDTTHFLATAMNFLAGEGWRGFMGGPLVGWPPLFPLLLAAFGWVGIDLLAAGRFVHATAFGLTILAAGYWLRSNLRSQWLGLAATATIAAALPLNHWMSFLLTDPLFVLFTLLALVQLAAFLNRRTDAPLWWAAVFTALAALTRWPGVALIGSGVLLLGLRARRKHILIFGAVSSLPLLAVLAHNWAVTGNLTQATGPRSASGQPLSDGLRRIISVLRDWVVPPNAPDGVAYLLGLALAAVGLAGATVILRARRMHRAAPEAAPAQGRLGPVLPFGVFAVGYPVFLVFIVPFTTATQGIDSRYLLPVYVPLLLTAVVLLDRFLSIEAAGGRVAVRFGLATLVGLATLAHVGYSARENLQLTAHAWGAGYVDRSLNTAYWQQSETVNYLRENPIDGRIHTNNATLVWFMDRTAGVRKYRHAPRKMWPQIKAGAHIVWFKDRLTHRLIDLRVLSGVETVAELADGFILRRTAAEPFDADEHRARKQRYVNQLIQQADERVVRAGWHVYRMGRTLIYRKKPCGPADVQAKFVLHVVPVDRADLPANRKQYDSENLDFYFNWHGERVGDECRAIVRLPAYAIDRIHIGQWISAENRTLWDATFSPSR